MDSKQESHKLRLGGTDLNRLILGDWYVLYREKLGIQPKKPFANTIHSQLGVLTEDFHGNLIHRALNDGSPHKWQLTKPDDLFYHPVGWTAPVDHVAQVDFMVASEGKTYPVEVKFPHHTRWFTERLNAYYTQLQWQCYVTLSSKVLLSCLWIDRHEWQWVDRDDDYINLLLDIATDFEWHLIEKTPPKRTLKL